MHSFRDCDFSPVNALTRLITAAGWARDISLLVAMSGVRPSSEGGFFDTYVSIRGQLQLRWGFRNSEYSTRPDEAFIELRDRFPEVEKGDSLYAVLFTSLHQYGSWMLRARNADDIPWLQQVNVCASGDDRDGFWVRMSDDSARLAFQGMIDQFQAAGR